MRVRERESTYVRLDEIPRVLLEILNRTHGDEVEGELYKNPNSARARNERLEINFKFFELLGFQSKILQLSENQCLFVELVRSLRFQRGD